MCILFAYKSKIRFNRVRGTLIHVQNWFPLNILWKNWWIWIIFCIHTNFPLKQWPQGLNDTDYQLPILFLKYHIPDRDNPNFLLCQFFLQTSPSISWILQNIFFNSNKNLCDLIPAGATPLSVDVFLIWKHLTWYQSVWRLMAFKHSNQCSLCFFCFFFLGGGGGAFLNG